MTDHVENIGEPGAQRRQRNGLVWVAVTGVMVVVFIVMNVPRPTRLLIAIPVGFAAVGFLQAREKT